MAGPFAVTSEIPGPFKVDCPSYDLASLATVVEGETKETSWFDELEGDPRAWVALLAICAVTAVAGWLARKRWPYATALLYTLWVAAVFAPVLLSLAVVWGKPDDTLNDAMDILCGIYTGGWPLWVFCGVAVLSQVLLLAVPIRVARERPIPRRSIWATAIAAAVLFSLVVLGMAVSAAAAIWGDDALDESGVLLILVLLDWALWTWVFRGFVRAADPHAYVHRLMKWLLCGSILELLVAVPSHIIVRHKDVCCAHAVTALGIATGLVVMLISFGPGIYFLYAQRIRSRTPGTSVAPE
ncbi:MAG: hypothetical protein KBE65_15970 [Phycisphaerae bacterium]|nr:hypothetical protein [Phycisphaerae bacterium]